MQILVSINYMYFKQETEVLLEDHRGTIQNTRMAHGSITMTKIVKKLISMFATLICIIFMLHHTMHYYRDQAELNHLSLSLLVCPD